MHSDAPNSVLLGSFGAKANNKMVCQILIINHKNCLPSIKLKVVNPNFQEMARKGVFSVSMSVL